MRIPTIVTAAVLGLALLVPSLAAAAGPKPEDYRLLGSAGDAKGSEPWGATLAVHLGLGGTFDTEGTEADAAPTLGVTPVLERRFGPNFALGFEWMFLWVKGDDYDGDRSKLWAPHVRARISFPVYPKVEVGAMMGIGFAMLLPDEGDTEFAFPSYRFAFGGSYQFAPTVRAFGDIGYMATRWTTDVKVNDKEKEFETKFGTVMLSTGLMAVF